MTGHEGTARVFSVTQLSSADKFEPAMFLGPADPVRLEKNLGTSQSGANPAIRQKPATRSIGRWCSDLFRLGRSSAHPPELVQFRSYRPSSMAFSAGVQHGKVVAEGSQAGRDIAGQLNQLPGRLTPAPGYAGKEQGLRVLDEKLNVFHIQSTPAVAAAFKSSCPLAGGAWGPDNPGRAHLGQVSEVHTTRDGSQFRLKEQRLYRFEPQTCAWLADKDEGKYTRLGLTREGALMKVPQGVSDLSIAGQTQASLRPCAQGAVLHIHRDKGVPVVRLTPVSESGEPVQLTCIGLAGDVLYASNLKGELLRGDLRTAREGDLEMVREPIGQLGHFFKDGITIKGFMHDDNAQLNALFLDASKQLHSSPLTDGAGLAPGWNLSDVMFKAIDKGVPQPGPGALAGAVDLGVRGKVALQGNTLLCWDSPAQRWEQTDQLNVDHLERGLDGRAYVLQDGQLKVLVPHKTWEPLHMGASYDLAPPNGAQTRFAFEAMTAGSERIITGFAVDSARRFVSLDHNNQLHAHIDGKETALRFSKAEDVRALALDHLGNLYGQTKTGKLLRLEKAFWQNPSSSHVAWTSVKLPGNEQLKTLRMGADKHLVASWGENHPQLKRWGEKYRQLNILSDGALQWEPLAAQSKTRVSSLGSVLSGGELKTQNHATSLAVSSTVLGQTTEGVKREGGYFKGLSAHFKPYEGIKNIAHDLQHRIKGRVGMAGLYDSDKALRQQLKPLASAPQASPDLTARLERLQGHEPLQGIVKALNAARLQVEKSSESSASRLGELHGTQTPPGPDKTVTVGDPESTLHQIRKAFENLSPSTGNRTLALLRSYEQQGVVLSKWSADNKRDLKNPTALIESDLIHHALTLSHLSGLISRLEEPHPDVTHIAASLENVMQDYHDNPVHKKTAQNINNYAQAEDLYKNFKLLAKDLGTPGSALHFHIARTLGVGQGGDLKQALMREVQQSESGQTIGSSRNITKSAGLLALGIAPVPFLEFYIGASRGKSNGVTISRTDEGATVKISMDTKHALTTSVGTSLAPFSVGDVIGADLKLGVKANLGASHEKGASISFDVEEADFPRMMEILTGERGDVFDLLDLGKDHKYGHRSKNNVDLSVFALAQGRVHYQALQDPGPLAGLVRTAIGGSASLNLVHFDQGSSVIQGLNEVTHTQEHNVQLLNKGGVSIGVAPGNTSLLAQVEPQGSSLVGFTWFDSSLSVNFDRSRSGALNFTFKPVPAVEQIKVNDMRDALSGFSPQAKRELQALPSEGDIGEQLQSLHRLLDRLPTPKTGLEEQAVLKANMQTLLQQHQWSTQGRRELGSVERTVSYVGLDGDAEHGWMDDTAAANKAAIIRMLQSQPQLARTLKELESNKGTSVSVGLEVKPDVLRMIESVTADGGAAQDEVERALKNTDNLRIKSLCVNYTASRTHSMELTLPVLAFASSASLSHTHKILNTEFEYGIDQNTPVLMKFKDVLSPAQEADLNPELLEQNIRNSRRPVF